ncbi:lactococcin 972 family bacteriocin [Streptomyces sp. Tue6028]|uniref:lactococcin 972 family bacteriocin n=1 Tax=Streptomyces sp. Tue6028 TaxID=2036037 RepID=UPI00117C5D92|nr:lactococcin 972 family bacteriocin [Streptomyces sp. Tue6028]
MTLKALRKSVLFAAAAAALTAGAVIAPAASAGAAELKPAKSGMAVININSSLRSASGETHTKDVGGGSWTYGWELTTGGKRCFSHYFHGSKMHHATARIGNAENKDYAFARQTAKASATAGSAYTCNAYWSLDE